VVFVVPLVVPLAVTAPVMLVVALGVAAFAVVGIVRLLIKRKIDV
jgi:hypothetical protein